VSHRELVVKLTVLSIGAFAFSFALVPLYDAFCELTGFGGRTAGSAAAIGAAEVDPSRTVRVEFVTSLGPVAPWTFRPGQSSVDVHPGELVRARFEATNLTDRSLVGQAVPSVSPGLAAQHFKKVECFCFDQQAFAANETRDLEVVFAVSPELPDYVDTLTLSYTLYAVPQRAAK
jgi:cytochrome c oxidase assembly protein subunit 11